ncbi:twin-arginine translocase TatA/TatE family subunit [Agromyces badenianii]|uniref:twin-arginine translocase TatA/TatE family subunit n=1 Tax=Agromyces badenianii TaxID=2080742 RepID=UPI000D592593|nr:twin-arginine translocase TatA/TatE family subunit [Agromyces badenianii]PWC05374.1 preprotein translocase [Agromyces badenianii]
MFANLTGWHLLVVVFVILLLFGAPKLPALAKSLGQSMHILKKEVRSTDDSETPAPASVTTSDPASAKSA